MGRIEEALAKLQTRGRETNAPPAGQADGDTSRARGASATGAARARIARVSERNGSAVVHRYGGRSIEIDVDALRANGLLAPDAAMERMAEEYRIIKRPLLVNADPAREPVNPLANLIMVASALSGEGKTFTCVNLCMSIARERDWTVVLVDGDCIKPQLTQLFGAEHEPGLLDLLKDPSLAFESVVMPTSIPGVALLPAGRRDLQSSELLASRRMKELCEQISAQDPNRILLFDSSPLLLTSEATVLAAQAGQIVLVVRANGTPRQAVVSALEKVDHSKPVACVLNQQSAKLGLVESYYGYGDYRYGERGSAGQDAVREAP